MANFDLIFDNGGGITLQCESAKYVHVYDYPKQAAQDVWDLLNGADPGDWEGNEKDIEGAWITYDPQVEFNGGYKWFTRTIIERLLSDPDFQHGWANVREFFFYLQVLASNHWLIKGKENA